MAAAHAGIPVTEFPEPPASAPPTTIEVVPDSVEVPDLFGLTPEEAATLLDGTSLGLTPVEVEDETFAPGTVINQSPPPLTPVPGGANVIIEVAVLPNILTVPNIIGVDVDTARRTVNQQGFTSTRIFLDAEGNFVNRAGRDAVVLRQDPQPGTEAEAGTTVNIVLEVQDSAPPETPEVQE